MQKTQSIPKVRRGITYLDIPNENGETTFVSPAFGPNTYSEVGKEITGKGLEFPTGDDTANLLYAAYCIPEVNDESELKNVRDIMRKRWLWVGNRNLWTVKGVYVVQDQEAKGRSETLSVNELESELKNGKELSWGGVRISQDGRVRFAPKESYELGGHTPESLAKDGFVIASYNQEGAEKLGEVSDKFNYKPKTWGLNIQEGQDPEQRVSAVGGDNGGRLSVGGNSLGGNDGGAAFGVAPSEK